jgi:hypothetical protein
MQMIISRAGVTGVADIADNFALVNKLPRREAVGLAL